MEVRIISTRRDGSQQVSLRYSKYALKQAMNRCRESGLFVKMEVYNLEGHTGAGQLIHTEQLQDTRNGQHRIANTR